MKSLIQPVSFVYSSLPLKTIDLTDQDGIATNFQIPKSVNLIFISLGSRGIMVVDGKSYEVIYEYKSDDFLNAVGVTSDAKYVFFSQNNSFSAFEFVNREKLVFIKSASFGNLVIMDIVISQDNQYAFVVGQGGKLAAYYIGNPQEMELVSQVITQATFINRINISSNGKWLFVGDNELGFTLVKVEYQTLQNKQTLKLKVAGNGHAYWKVFECAPTKDLTYIYCTDYWDGIYIAELTNILSAPESQYPIDIQFKKRAWPLDYLNPIVFSIKLLKDDQYLLVCVRSLGVFIFDISDREELIFYQQIEVEGQPVQLAISPFDENIIYSNKVSLNVFKQTPPNLNNSQPNLFNGHQSMIVEFYPSVFYKWRCYLSQDDQYLFSTQDYKGLVIAKLRDGDPYKLEKTSLIEAIPPNFVEAASITANRKFIFQAVQEDKCTLKVFDITNLDNITIAQCLNIDEPTQHAEEQALSDDETLLALSYDDGVLLIDVTNPYDNKILSYWKMGDLMIGNLAGVMITKDKRWVLGTVRGYGVFALDIQDPKNPIYTDDINTHGGETIKVSPTKQQFAYLVDGYRGVAVIDLYALPKLSIVSRVQLKGWSNDLSAVMDDKYLLVSTMDDGQLTLVDSSNPFSLRVISMFQEEPESAQSACFTSDLQYAFINNDIGTRIMPLVSKIILHTDILEFSINDSDGSLFLSRLSKEYALTVGQNIQLNFIPMYYINGMIISDILYYSQSKLQMQSLPKWMSLINNNWSLTFTVPKESLGADVSTPVENTIVIKSVLKLQAQDFVFKDGDVITTPNQAEQIFDQIKDKMHLIDDRGFLTGRFHYNTKIVLQDIGITDQNKLDRLQQNVKLKLQMSVFYNPVIFQTQSSLSFSKKNSTEIISSPSSNIKINIQFINNQSFECIFVNVAYSGCIQELSSDQYTIQLTGTRKNINKVLSSQLIYHCKLQQSTQTQIQVTIVDNLNYDLINIINVEEAYFLKLLDPITTNTKSLSLQQQFESQFQNSQIAIETDINFSFDQNHFKQPQQSFLPITYSLQYYSDDEEKFIETTSGYWIKLEKDQLKFFGYAKQAQLSTKERLKIIASNGYQESEEELIIYIELVSFLYVLNIFLRVFGFLIGPVGLYKFKSQITNFILNNKTLFSDELAIINQPFLKQITIMSNDFDIAQALFNKYKSDFLNGNIELLAQAPKYLQNKQTIQIVSSNQSQNKDDNYQQYFTNLNNNTNNSQQLINFIPNNQNNGSILNNFNNTINNQQQINILPLNQNNLTTLNQNYLTTTNQNNGQALSQYYSQAISQNGQLNSQRNQLQKFNNINLFQIDPDLPSRRKKSIQFADDDRQCQSQLGGIDDSQINQNKSCQIGYNTKYEKRVYESRKKTMSYSSNLVSLMVNDQKNQKYLKKRAKSVSSVLLNPNQAKKNFSISKFHYEQNKEKQFQGRYINQEGILQFDLLIQDMTLNKTVAYFEKKKYSMDSLKPILKNENSVFYNCLKSVACRYFLNCDPKTLHLYKYLKEYALLSSSYLNNDWYKYYFDITYYSSECSQSEDDIQNYDDDQEDVKSCPRPKTLNVFDKERDPQDIDVVKNPLPLCKLRENVINDLLVNLQIHTDRNKDFDSIIEQGINPYLIRNVLLADALGFYKTKYQYFLPSHGESIHTHPHQIKSIQASYLVPNSGCFKNGKQTESYQPFSLQMQLPQWLTAKVVRNSLILQGTPSYSDEKVIQIKIINNSNLVIRKFRICLLQEYNSSFTQLAKFKKIEKIQPVFANYFHDKQKSIKEEEFQFEENTYRYEGEEKKDIDNPITFKSITKYVKPNQTQQSNRDFSIKDEKLNNKSGKVSVRNGFTQVPQSELPLVENGLNEDSSQISKEEKQETMQMMEFNVADLNLMNSAVIPIFPFAPQFSKGRSHLSNQNLESFSFNLQNSNPKNQIDQVNENETLTKVDDKINSSYENTSFI